MSGVLSLERFDELRPSGGLLDFGSESDDPVAAEVEVIEEPELTDSEETQEACELALRAETLGRIEQALGDLLDSTRQSRRTTINLVAERTGKAVERLLPHLLDEAACTELAACVVAVIEKGQIAAAELSVAPEDYEVMIECIAALQSPLQLKVERAPDRRPGTAGLSWNLGGAEFDISDFLTPARQILRDRQSLGPDGEPGT